MAKEILPVNFKDDIMSEAMEGRRRYRMIQNPDGTVSFEDTTEYDQVGSQFGQGQINKTNQAVNESLDKGRVIDNINDIVSNSEAGYVMGALAGKELNQNLGGLSFYEDETGKYVVGADSVPKKLGGEVKLISSNVTGTVSLDLKNVTNTYTNLKSYNFIFTLNHIYLYISSWGSANDKHGEPASKNFSPLTGLNYNNQNGILSFTINKTSITSGNYGHLAGGTCDITPYYDIYLIE